MIFKFLIFLLCLILLTQATINIQTLRLLQDGSVPQKKDSNPVDGGNLLQSPNIVKANDDPNSQNNTQGPNTNQPILTQQLPGQTASTDDQYQHLPVDLDTSNPTQQPGLLGQTPPSPSTLSDQQPHIPYKGQENFTYPDDSLNPAQQVNTQAKNSSVSTGQQQATNIFEEGENDKEHKIDDFKPEEIEKMTQHNATEAGQIHSEGKKNENHQPQQPQHQGDKNNTTHNNKENQTHEQQNNQTHSQQQNQTQHQNTTQQQTKQENTTKQHNQTQPISNTTNPQHNTTANHSTTPDPSIALLQQKITHLTQQVKTLQTSNNLLTGEKNQLQNQLLINKKQSNQLKQDLEHTKTQIKELQVQFETKLATAEKKNHNLDEEIKRLTEENNKLTEESKKLMEDNKKLTQENAKLKTQNQKLEKEKTQPVNPQVKPQENKPEGPNIQTSNVQSTQILTKLQQQKVMLQNEQKKLNDLNQAINNLKIQNEASHQVPSNPSIPVNPIPTQQLNSLDKKLSQLQNAVQQMTTEQKTHQSLSSQQENLLNQVLQEVKSLRSAQSTPSTTTQPSQSSEKPSDPQSVRQSHTPTGIQKQQTGYRVDVLVDWMSIYIMAGITGAIVLILSMIKVCKRCRNIKRGKAEDQKQLKTPQSMESRSTEEQFSDWQG